MWRRVKSNRTGGVYIAVLGSALVVSLLGISALVGQRIENRAVVASADIRQAQLNANSAIEMGLLAMKQESNWRTARSHGAWFSARDTGAGTCTLEVLDPLDGNLANDPDDPVVMVGVGYRGDAQQRVKLTVEPQSQALSSLRSAIAAGDTINVQGNILRTNGLITANQVTATSAQVYGDVEAASVSGSTFAGTTQQVDAAKLPKLPNWANVFDFYRNNGSQILINNIPPANTNNVVQNHNPGAESGTIYWTGIQPGAPAITATLSASTIWSRSGQSLRVTARSSWQAGAIHRIEHFVKPGQQYDVDVWVALNESALIGLGSRDFRLSLHVKGTNDAGELVVTTPSASATWVTVILDLLMTPANITGRLTVPNWSGDLEYAFVKISDSSSSGGTDEFFVDNLVIREFSTGRRIFRRVLGPGTGGGLVGTPNPQGLYWIDCGGQRLTIERSRIVGTLLLVNPGPGSGISHGPIHWTPAVAGYPALLVDTDSAPQFSISSTDRVLSEAEQRVNFNPTGAPHEQFGSDTNELNDIYPSVIRGMVAIEGDFVFQNRPFVRGQLLVGGDIANSAGELDVEYQADSLLNPPPGFFAPHTHSRRPGSVAKDVLP
ncbi:MAG TPA: carbohydrate binding domain-containing protein [Lacipirellulaceae bacterium]|nr:carbohydrate binding domain-containing protein [Lacipirellulaceae bacterium]